VPNSVSFAAPIADLAHGEKLRTHLHSLFDAAENQARTSAIYNTISVTTARTDLHHTERLPVLVQLTKCLLPGHRPPLMKYNLQAESPFSTSATQTSCRLQCVSHNKHRNLLKWLYEYDSIRSRLKVLYWPFHLFLEFANTIISMHGHAVKTCI